MAWNDRWIFQLGAVSLFRSVSQAPRAGLGNIIFLWVQKVTLLESAVSGLEGPVDLSAGCCFRFGGFPKLHVLGLKLLIDSCRSMSKLSNVFKHVLLLCEIQLMCSSHLHTDLFGVLWIFACSDFHRSTDSCPFRDQATEVASVR